MTLITVRLQPLLLCWSRLLDPKISSFCWNWMRPLSLNSTKISCLPGKFELGLYRKTKWWRTCRIMWKQTAIEWKKYKTILCSTHWIAVYFHFILQARCYKIFKNHLLYIAIYRLGNSESEYKHVAIFRIKFNRVVFHHV